MDIQKRAIKKLVTHVESHASAVTARERRLALYKSYQQQQEDNTMYEIFYFINYILSHRYNSFAMYVELILNQHRSKH